MSRECLDKVLRGLSNFAYSEHGKPFIPNGPCFSISHCKEGIAVVVDDKPVGIDIEGVRRADDDLIVRTMNKAEQEQIRNAENRDRAFTRLWTQKEAVVKCEGVGICSFEQLQSVLRPEYTVETVETEKYIYSIAYKK